MDPTARARYRRALGVMALAPAMLAWALVAPLASRAQDATPDSDLAGLSGTITAAGSGTLGPVIEAAAEAFAEQAPDVAVTVEISSSGRGFERFCAGETDLQTSGRPINDEEEAACAGSGVDYDAFEVAYDGVAVVVNPAADFLTCLTVDQLARLWEPDSAVSTWQDLDPAWPADPIALHARGEDSGTYQFFTQAIVGEEGLSRDDYTVHDSHQAIADAVAADEDAEGVLPFPRYEENRDTVKLIEVDAGDGCVAPGPETILDGTYAPLSRPMFLYVKRESLERPEVAEFLRFYLADHVAFAEAAGLVADAAAQAALSDTLGAAIAGTSDPDGPPSATPTP